MAKPKSNTKKKSLVKRRRESGAICSICKSPDYTIEFDRYYVGCKPFITCGQCGNSWAYGWDGGVYVELLT